MKRFWKTGIMILLIALLGCLMIGTAGADEITLADNLSYYGGWTTINWTSTDGGSHIIYLEAINNGEAPQDVWNLGTTSANSIQTQRCVPGKAYRVTVCDEQSYILAEKDYWLPQAPTFEDGKLKNTSVKISTEFRSYPASNLENWKKIKSLSSADIISGADSASMYYGMKYQMRMPTLVKPRTFFVTLVYEAPNGFLYVDKAQDITFDKVSGGCRTIWWNIAGVDFFDSLYHTTGVVPIGTYTATLYWDGMWVNTLEFSVRQ